jgi:hypothetical protein
VSHANYAGNLVCAPLQDSSQSIAECYVERGMIYQKQRDYRRVDTWDLWRVGYSCIMLNQVQGSGDTTPQLCISNLFTQGCMLYGHTTEPHMPPMPPLLRRGCKELREAARLDPHNHQAWNLLGLCRWGGAPFDMTYTIRFSASYHISASGFSVLCSWCTAVLPPVACATLPMWCSQTPVPGHLCAV